MCVAPTADDRPIQRGNDVICFGAAYEEILAPAVTHELGAEFLKVRAGEGRIEKGLLRYVPMGTV
jgi:hypothetical protein